MTMFKKYVPEYNNDKKQDEYIKGQVAQVHQQIDGDPRVIASGLAGKLAVKAVKDVRSEEAYAAKESLAGSLRGHFSAALNGAKKDKTVTGRNIAEGEKRLELAKKVAHSTTEHPAEIPVMDLADPEKSFLHNEHFGAAVGKAYEEGSVILTTKNIKTGENVAINPKKNPYSKIEAQLLPKLAQKSVGSQYIYQMLEKRMQQKQVDKVREQVLSAWGDEQAKNKAGKPPKGKDEKIELGYEYGKDRIHKSQTARARKNNLPEPKKGNMIDKDVMLVVDAVMNTTSKTGEELDHDTIMRGTEQVFDKIESSGLEKLRKDAIQQAAPNTAAEMAAKARGKGR